MSSTRLSQHLRGHLLLFDHAPQRIVPRAAWLAAGAVALEGICLVVIRPLSSRAPSWILLPALLALSLVAVRLAGVRFGEFGFRPWREWSTTEKSYFLQVLVIANVVFAIVRGPGSTTNLWTVFVPYFCFGFYQEVVYRGMLQSGLVQWLGAPLGIVGANVLFTFGPMHWNYFGMPASVAIPGLAAIFVVGLYFGVLYQRTRNLWLPAIFHAIGNAWMVWGGVL